MLVLELFFASFAGNFNLLSCEFDNFTFTVFIESFYTDIYTKTKIGLRLFFYNTIVLLKNLE